MQTFKNLRLQKYSTEFFDIAHTLVLRYIKACLNGGPTKAWACVIKVCSNGYNYNVKLYNITIIVQYNICQVSIRSVGLVKYIYSISHP